MWTIFRFTKTVISSISAKQTLYIFFLKKWTVVDQGQGDYLRPSAQQFPWEWRSSTHSWKRSFFHFRVENRNQKFLWRRFPGGGVLLQSCSSCGVAVEACHSFTISKEKKWCLIPPALALQIFTFTGISLKTQLGFLCWLKCGFHLRAVTVLSCKRLCLSLMNDCSIVRCSSRTSVTLK